MKKKSKPEEEESEPISTTQAAELLGVSRKRVNQFIDQGRLPAKRIGKVWIIDPKDLTLVANRPKKAGRPKKATSATTEEDEDE